MCVVLLTQLLHQPNSGSIISNLKNSIPHESQFVNIYFRKTLEPNSGLKPLSHPYRGCTLSVELIRLGALGGNRTCEIRRYEGRSVPTETRVQIPTCGTLLPVTTRIWSIRHNSTPYEKSIIWTNMAPSLRFERRSKDSKSFRKPLAYDGMAGKTGLKPVTFAFRARCSIN